MSILPSLLLAATTLSVPGAHWRAYARPADAGFDAAGLDAARTIAEEADSAAVLVVAGGHVVVAWGEIDRPFRCHSVRKSLVSALYGIAVEAGDVDLQATLDELGIDDLQPLDEAEREARVADLLAARSGVYHPAAKEPADMTASRPARGSHAPGTHWWYNNWDFNTLGTIYEQETGTALFEAFERELARPLAFEDFRPEHGLRQLEPSHSVHAAHAFRLSARDLARFGLLFARGGRWGEQEIVPASWVTESTSPISPFEGGGYGFMWWSYPAGGLPGLPALDAHDKFAARGTGGQFLLVVPDLDFVLVHRGDTDNDRSVDGRAIWRLAETVVAARRGAGVEDARLVPVEPEPFANPGPRPPEREVLPLDPADLPQLTGDYEVGPGYRVTVFDYEGRLFVRSPEGELELFRETKDRFFALAHDLTVTFERNADGRADLLRGELSGRPMVARRL